MRLIMLRMRLLFILMFFCYLHDESLFFLVYQTLIMLMIPFRFYVNYFFQHFFRKISKQIK